jgi:putative hydrolase of the HAD superfamily
MAVKAIFFDAAGTLIKPVRRVGESYSVFAQQYGMQVSPSEVNERFRTCFHSAPPLAFPDTGELDTERLERAWWKALVRRVFAPWERFDRFDEYFAELFTYFGHPAAWTLYAEVPEVLSALRERGLILDVISNFDSRLIGILEGLDVARWFEHIFLSSRLGHAKPARQIFQAALERHGLEAGEAWHVGDSEENDLCGATNAGLRGFLIDRAGDSIGQTSSRIKSLKDILLLLDNLRHGSTAP